MHLANQSSGKPDMLSQGSIGGTLDIREALRGLGNSREEILQTSRELEQPEREDNPQK